MYIYRAVRQALSTPETGPYTTFGILALRLEAGQWQKVCLTADMSTSRSFAADLRDGSGTYTWANGTTYRGTWKAGEARKGGTYSYTDAGVKEGLSAGGNLTMQD